MTGYLGDGKVLQRHCILLAEEIEQRNLSPLTRGHRSICQTLWAAKVMKTRSCTATVG